MLDQAYVQGPTNSRDTPGDGGWNQVSVSSLPHQRALSLGYLCLGNWNQDSALQTKTASDLLHYILKTYLTDVISV